MSGLARMRAWVDELPRQLREGAHLPGLAAVAPLAAPPQQVLLCGMGGSAAAGDLVPLAWLGPARPWHVCRDEGLPAWAGPSTLVIASSYSGQTREALAAFAEAGRRGCALAAVTTGGALAAAARAAGAPLVTLPAGLPPRAALGHAAAALLHLLHRLGLADDPQPSLAAAADHLAAGPLADCDGQPAGRETLARLAAGLADRCAVIYAGGAEARPAAHRLKNQLNENAKLPAAVAEYPELAHNDIVGWELPPARREGFALLALRGGDESALGARGLDAALDLVDGQFAAVHRVRALGAAPLARVMGLIHFADLLSVEVAARRGVDPVPITRIEALKRALAPTGT